MIGLPGTTRIEDRAFCLVEKGKVKQLFPETDDARLLRPPKETTAFAVLHHRKERLHHPAAQLLQHAAEIQRGRTQPNTELEKEWNQKF